MFDTVERDPPGPYLSHMAMKDIIGMMEADSDSRSAMVDFSYYLTTGECGAVG